jgi:D-3-phosphoglycerate dehydrogenase
VSIGRLSSRIACLARLCYRRLDEGKELPMANTIENLILDLLEWVGREERTYQETMDAWRTSCPRLPVWEDANDRGLVETGPANGQLVVRVTLAGLALLKEKRPHSHDVPTLTIVPRGTRRE